MIQLQNTVGIDLRSKLAVGSYESVNFQSHRIQNQSDINIIIIICSKLRKNNETVTKHWKYGTQKSFLDTTEWCHLIIYNAHQ